MSDAATPLPTTLAECHAKLLEQQAAIDELQATIDTQQATIDDRRTTGHARSAATRLSIDEADGVWSAS